MALPKSYLTSTKNLKSILEAIQAAQAPDKFTTRFLETLGFPSSNDRLLIGVLKSLGFLDSDGKPQDRYFRFLDQTQSQRVLAEGIRDAYSDLFTVRKDAQNLSKAEVINKAKTLSQGSLSEAVLEKFALTFSALCALADFSESEVKVRGEHTEQHVDTPTPMQEIPVAQDMNRNYLDVGAKRHSLGGLHYNIQIVLPPTRDPAIYDAIFKSLKEHLIE